MSIKLAILLLVLAAAGTPASVQAAPPKTPFSVILLSFDDLRRGAGEDWLGRFLRESLTGVFARLPQVAVYDPDTGPLWRARLGLFGTERPDLDALHQLGAGVVLLGATQQVLTLADVRIRAVGAEGELLPQGEGSWRILLNRDTPGEAVRRIATELGDAIVPSVPLHFAPAPRDWAQVQSLYGLLILPLDSGDLTARPRRIARLEGYLEQPALAPRAHEALARLYLEQAMLHMPEGDTRIQGLRRALAHATAAFKADPRNTWLQALKGEVHFFLREYHEARTEASIARIRNPLNGLAYVVLGLVSGLSTGESIEQFNRAFKANPFLREGERPIGSPPYQGGLLEPRFTEWSRLKAARMTAVRPDYKAVLAKGIALFDLEKWEEADEQLQEAARLEQDDFTPWLYMHRILIETGRAGLAVQPLRKLAQDYPEETEIRYHLGVAMERSGENAAALEVFEKLQREKPNDPQVLFHLAGTQMGEGLWTRARNTLQTLLRTESGNAEAWHRLGQVFERLKDTGAAEAAYREVLRIEPGHDQAQRRLLELHESTTPKS